MIIGFFLSLFLSILQFVIGLLPAATGTLAFPAAITTAVATIGYYMNAWSYIFPVSTLLSVLVVAFLFHGAVFVWHFFHMIMRYIRGR